MRRLSLTLAFVLVGFAVSVAQGPIGPFSNTPLRSADGALSAAPQGPCGTLGPLTPGANVPVRSDDGALHVCGDFGSVTIGDTQVAYATSADTLGGEAAFTYNDTSNVLTATGGFSDGTNFLLKHDGTRPALRTAADDGYAPLRIGNRLIIAGGDDSFSIGDGSTDQFRHIGASTGFTSMLSTWMMRWANGASVGGGATFDTGISRNAAGVVEINTGTAGAFGDTRVRHYLGGGTAPAVSNTSANSCGTTAATLAGTDTAGKVTVGATSGTSCTVTFTAAYTNAPACVVTNETTANLARATSTTTTVILAGTFVGADVLAYQCLGY